MFEIKREISVKELKGYNGKTIHSSDRLYRYKSNEQVIYRAFVVDKGHVNGMEIHAICEDATILIYNERTKKLITVMNARVGQLKRYGVNKSSILKEAINNVKKNLNN